MSTNTDENDIHSLQYLRPEVREIKKKVDWFVQYECIPAEKEFEEHLRHRSGTDRWTMDAIPPCLYRLQRIAKEMRIWNLFLPPKYYYKVQERFNNLPSELLPPVPLSYREYGIMAESLGRCPEIAPQACNCSAPDTGNMEVLIDFGTEQQQHQYLLPLLRGEIRSTFLMTEPDVGSSDPTNLESQLTKIIMIDKSSTMSQQKHTKVEYILNGRKWWSTGAMDPRCRVALAVVKMDYSHESCRDQQQHQSTGTTNTPSSKKHGAHTIVIVPIPHPGVSFARPLTVFGHDDAPFGHAEVVLKNVTLYPTDLILGEGSGFQVSQARLGPGRIHHCMRAVGMASRCYELMLERTTQRQTFGKYLWEHGGCQDLISDSFTDLNAARLLTLECAALMDSVGVQYSRHKIASIKVSVPQLTSSVVDRAVQVFGGAGVSEDYVLARFLINLRALRIADGPDAVHKRSVALAEIKRVKKINQPNSRL